MHISGSLTHLEIHMPHVLLDGGIIPGYKNEKHYSVSRLSDVLAGFFATRDLPEIKLFAKCVGKSSQEGEEGFDYARSRGVCPVDETRPFSEIGPVKKGDFVFAFRDTHVLPLNCISYTDIVVDCENVPLGSLIPIYAALPIRHGIKKGLLVHDTSFKYGPPSPKQRSSGSETTTFPNLTRSITCAKGYLSFVENDE